MLTVSKEMKGEATLLRMSGSIEETADLSQLIGSVSREVIVNTSQVARVNSSGVVAWIRYFADLKNKGVRLRFVECSSAIVEQVNLIVNFLVGGSPESIFVHYACSGCKKELRSLFDVATLRGLQGRIPDGKCPDCGSKAAFDDDEAYLAFLQRP
jgi:DNA-directed RNA polymerase subunit RPC12/RpoP/ABC-type transporter Mla MlaB component